MGVLVLILILCQGRTRIETIGVILFCALMTTVAVQLLIESGRTLGTCKTESEELYIIPIIFVCIAITSETPVQYTPLSDNYFSFLQGIFDVVLHEISQISIGPCVLRKFDNGNSTILANGPID